MSSKKPVGGRKLVEIELDWIYISKDSVKKWLIVALAVVAVVAGVTLVRGGEDSERRAKHEIADAQDLLNRCRLLPQNARPREEIDAAVTKVSEAKSSLASSKYSDAIASAVAAQQIARKVLGTPLRGDANIVESGGKVEVQRANRSTWEAAKIGMKLFEGDFVKTGATGACEIMAADGTLFRIKAETLFEVQKTTSVPGAGPGEEGKRSGIKLVVGVIDTNTGENTRTTVKTDAATADIGSKSSVAIDVDTSKTTGVSAFRGNATLTTENGQRVVLNDGERVVASARSGVLSPKVRIPDAPEPLAPDNNATFDLRKQEPVKLKWSAVREVARYHLQISRSKLFITDSLIQDLNDRVKTEVGISLVEEGTFFWRVAALGKGAVTSDWSEMRRFKVAAGNLASAGKTRPPDLVLDRPKIISNYVLVSGKTDPGSSVTVNGEPADVAAGGVFKKMVLVTEEGQQWIVVKAIDGAGNETVKRESVLIQTN